MQPASIESYGYTVRRLESYFDKDCAMSSISPKDAVLFVSKQKSMAIGHEGEVLSDWSREQVKKYSKLILRQRLIGVF